MVIIGLLALIRLSSLLGQSGWRNDLGEAFPSACGDWAEAQGCTRVTLEEAGCTRPDKIEQENSIVFPAKDNSPNFIYG